MGVSVNSGFSPQIIHFNRVFHYFHHPFWGFSPYVWKRIICRCHETILRQGEKNPYREGFSVTHPVDSIGPHKVGPKSSEIMKFHLSESHFPLRDFRPWKTPGVDLLCTYSITKLYVVGAPNFAIFFCGHIFFIIMGISKGSRLISWGPHLPGWHWGSPVVPLDSHSVGLFVQAALLAPHMGHLNFSLKNAPSRPLAEEDKKGVWKAAVKFPLVNEKQRKRWMTGLTHHVLRGESWFFVEQTFGMRKFESTCTCELRKLILHFDLKTNQMLGKFNPKN